MATSDNPAKWASRECNRLAGFIGEGTAWDWVRAKLVNTAIEIQAVDELINRVDAE